MNWRNVASLGFHHLLHLLHWTGYYLEHALVLLLEAVQRAVQWLDPRRHVLGLRVRKISGGLSCKPSAKFFIFVVYAKSTLPRFTANLIAALKESPFNLVVVSNATLDAAVTRELLQHCCLLIERKNIGRDFGGYKDAISIITNRYPLIDRLVIANDSVFYCNQGLKDLIAKLDGTEEFIGVSEVFEHHYHVASFLMSFGSRVVQSPAFRKFWRGYCPIDTRRWAIFRGEGALTAKLLKAGFRPHVLYRAEYLRPHLEACDFDEIMQSVSLLPLTARNIVGVKVAQAKRAELAEAIISAIMAHNQMHVGGFLFRKWLGLPLVKRDIFYREIYTFDEISLILADLESPLRDEILADVCRRGIVTGHGTFRKMLYRHSAA